METEVALEEKRAQSVPMVEFEDEHVFEGNKKTSVGEASSSFSGEVCVAGDWWEAMSTKTDSAYGR
jgi:hypothetical protein